MNQDMIRERESKKVCMQEEKKREILVSFMLAQPLRGRCMEWRGQWDAVIG